MSGDDQGVVSPELLLVGELNKYRSVRGQRYRRGHRWSGNGQKRKSSQENSSHRRLLVRLSSPSPNVPTRRVRELLSRDSSKRWTENALFSKHYEISCLWALLRQG